MKTILVLGSECDAHASNIARKLRARGVKVVFWNTITFPLDCHVSLDLLSENIDLRTSEGELVRLNDVEAVYWRNYSPPAQLIGPFIDNPRELEIASNDSQSLIETVLSSGVCRWVNGWEGFRLHFRKPEALLIAKRAGLDVPKTLVSNDLDIIRSFVGRTGKCILKPVRGGAHARRVTSRHLDDDNAASLMLSPVTIQEEIEGTINQAESIWT